MAARIVAGLSSADLAVDDNSVVWILGNGALNGCPDFPWFIRKGSEEIRQPRGHLVLTTVASGEETDRYRRLTGVRHVRTVPGPLPDSLLVARLRDASTGPRVVDARWLAPAAALARPARELRRLRRWLEGPDQTGEGPGSEDEADD